MGNNIHEELRFSEAVKYARSINLISSSQTPDQALSTVTKESYILVDSKGDLIARIALPLIENAIKKYLPSYRCINETSQERDAVPPNELDVTSSIQVAKTAAIVIKHFNWNWCQQNYVLPLSEEIGDETTLNVGICNPTYLSSVTSILSKNVGGTYADFAYTKLTLEHADSLIRLVDNAIKSNSELVTSVAPSDHAKAGQMPAQGSISQRIGLASTLGDDEDSASERQWRFLSDRYKKLTVIEKNFVFAMLGGLVALPFGIYSSICGAGSVLSVRTLVSSRSKIAFVIWASIFYSVYYFGGILVLNPISRHFTGLNILDEGAKELRTKVCLKELRKILHDAESLRVQDIEHETAEEPKESGHQYKVYISLRARNAFNAYRLAKYNCEFKGDGKLVSNWLDTE